MFCLLNCGCFYKIQLEEKTSILINVTFILLDLDVSIIYVVNWSVIAFIAILPHWMLSTSISFLALDLWYKKSFTFPRFVFLFRLQVSWYLEKTVSQCSLDWIDSNCYKSRFKGCSENFACSEVHYLYCIFQPAQSLLWGMSYYLFDCIAVIVSSVSWWILE